MLNKEKNFQSRLEFIKFWADYVKSQPNEIWSKQQADFINSQLRTANQDVELFKRVKRIAKNF